MKKTALGQKAIHAKTAAMMVFCFWFLNAGCATEGVKSGRGLFGYSNEVGETKGSFLTAFLNAQNADPLFPNDKARLIFLINAADPPNLVDDTAKDPRNLADLELSELTARLQYSLNKGDANPERQKQVRNNMQSQLIARSDLVCTDFTTSLQRLQSDSGFIFTSATAILGGLGAIFAPAATVRALSGAAAITAGVGAAYSSAMFHEKTISILAKAIEVKRKRFYEEAIKTNRDKPASTYILGEALKDATTYHSYCNVVDAFAETEEALAKRDEMGSTLKEMQKVADTLGSSIVLDRKSSGLDIVKDLNLTTNSVENAKERKKELIGQVTALLSAVTAARTNLGASSVQNEQLLKGVRSVETLANQSKLALEELVNQESEKNASDIAESLKKLFDKWINSPAGEDRNVLEKQVAAKHAEAKLMVSKVRERISDISEKVKEASTLLQRVQNARKLTLTNNLHATAKVKSDDGWVCESASCDRQYPDRFEAQLSVEAKTPGTTVTPKWSASCPEGKLTLTADVTCTVEPSP